MWFFFHKKRANNDVLPRLQGMFLCAPVRTANGKDLMPF